MRSLRYYLSGVVVLVPESCLIGIFDSNEFWFMVLVLEEDFWFPLDVGFWILVVFGIQEDFGFKEEHMF